MKLLSLHDAERSSDIDIKLVAVRSSRYRMSLRRRIPSGACRIDLRGGRTEDFSKRFRVLERHPMAQVMLVLKIVQ